MAGFRCCLGIFLCGNLMASLVLPLSGYNGFRFVFSVALETGWHVCNLHLLDLGLRLLDLGLRPVDGRGWLAPWCQIVREGRLIL